MQPPSSNARGQTNRRPHASQNSLGSPYSSVGTSSKSLSASNVTRWRSGSEWSSGPRQPHSPHGGPSQPPVPPLSASALPHSLRNAEYTLYNLPFLADVRLFELVLYLFSSQLAK